MYHCMTVVTCEFQNPVFRPKKKAQKKHGSEDTHSGSRVVRPDNVGQEAKSRVAHTQRNIPRPLIDMLGVYGQSTNMMRGTCCKKENVRRKNTIPGQELLPSRNSVSSFGCDTQKTWAGE